MRRQARVDDNHVEIVAALRRVGCMVVSLAPLGNGVPDLLCARAGRMYLLEVKDGRKRPSARRLTDDEERFRATWPGHWALVENVNDALLAVA